MNESFRILVQLCRTFDILFAAVSLARMNETELHHHIGNTVYLTHSNGVKWGKAELRKNSKHSPPWFLLIQTDAVFETEPKIKKGTPFFRTAAQLESIQNLNGELSLVLPLRRVHGESGLSIGE